MRAIELELPGALKIEHRVWPDERGSFVETWNEREFHKLGITDAFVQDNMSTSKQWTVRGLHYQVQQPQGKLVRVLAGAIYDVFVDLRRSSATFGRAIGVHLSAERAESLWIPAGFAHGFLSLADETKVAYKVTEFWAPQAERTLLWNDPALGIDWPVAPGAQPIVSAKDAAGLPFARAESYA
jgi:dTDP-4-dehydrorhamnose 3,5-epimerase